MPLHFEEVWVRCEEFHKAHQDNIEVSALIEELMIKLNLYRAIDATDLPAEDRQKVKSRTLGEILLTLTFLSLKDNINVYEALGLALIYRDPTFKV